VNGDDFERLAFQQSRKNARHAPRKQRLPAAWWSGEHQTMVARGGDLERTAGELLPHDIRKVRPVVVAFSRRRSVRTLETI
jgi:hypothetical protein